MKKLCVCLLAAFACMWNIPANAKSISGLGYSAGSDFTVSNTNMQEILPVELRKFSAASNQGIKFASVKSLVGLNKDDDFGLNEAELCAEYPLTSCPSGQIPADPCPYSSNGAYFASCVCDPTQYPIDASDHYDYAKECGSLATITSCSDKNGDHLSCDCSNQTETMVTCNKNNQYISTTGTISKPYLWCKDNSGKVTYPESACATCNSPSLVNDTKSNCTCPSSWVECGANQEGVGSACSADGNDKYVSCTCPSTYKECDTANNEQGQNACVENSTTLYETCGCPTGWASCTNGGAAGAQRCTMNGTDYWSSCQSCQNLGEYASETECRQNGAYLCTLEDCSNKWYRSGCASNAVSWCEMPETDCTILGYTIKQSECDLDSPIYRCPFDKIKVYCISATTCAQVPIEVPTNATCSESFAGTEKCPGGCSKWECNTGYIKDGGSCKYDCSKITNVTVPANASCTGSNTNCPSVCTEWACNSGYVKDGSSCKKDCSRQQATYDSCSDEYNGCFSECSPYSPEDYDRCAYDCNNRWPNGCNDEWSALLACKNN